MHKERVAEHFIKLNNGINMPMLGYGTLQITNDKLCEQCIYAVSYKHLDVYKRQSLNM